MAASTTNPGSYLGASSLFNSGAASVPGISNTDVACGKNYTTAPEDYISATKVNGVTEVKTRNPETQAIQYRILADNGAHFGIDESGSICLFSSMSPADDKTTGQFKQRCAGKYLLKVGNEMSIEVENKNDYAIPLSIKVYGNVNIQAEGGTMNLGGSDVTITAVDSMTINAGRTLQLNAGQGGSGGASSAVSSAINGVDTGEAGGKIELNAGEIIQKSSAMTSNVNVTYENISSERALEMKDPRGTFKIASKGHMEFSVDGDFIEKIKGKRKTTIDGLTATVPHPSAPKAATWEMQVGKSSEAVNDIQIRTYQGDIEIKQSAGTFYLTSPKGLEFKSSSAGKFIMNSKETALWGYNNLVVRANKKAQFGTSNTSYMQTDQAATKVNAPTIFLN